MNTADNKKTITVKAAGTEELWLNPKLCDANINKERVCMCVFDIDPAEHIFCQVRRKRWAVCVLTVKCSVSVKLKPNQTHINNPLTLRNKETNELDEARACVFVRI